MINESYFSHAKHRIACLLWIATAFILPSADAATKINGRSGATIFTLMCAECHTTGISGAPKISDKEGWAPRLKQGPDTLVQHALHGYKLMPSRGSCSSCSDAEIKAAVEYMIEKTK